MSAHPSRAAELARIAREPGDRSGRAERAAAAIRAHGGYRWVGLYDVLAAEIAVIAWSGPEAPTYPRFPRERGLNGAAVRDRAPVVVQDVAADERYLTTIGGTRGEAIFPVLGSAGAVVGTVAVAADRVNAFTPADRELLTSCASALAPLWR